MEPTGIAAIILIVLNLVVSYYGFTSDVYLHQYAFEVDEILIHKDYKRLITSGFLHVDWMHLLFNIITLAAFSTDLEFVTGAPKFLLIYFASLIGGNLMSLYIHRKHGDYSAVGASGAVCGIVFASIALFPGMKIGFWGLHAGIPAWLYGLAYVVYSIFGIKNQRDHIGHDAHLGGGVVGLIVALSLYPAFLKLNTLPVVLILVPAIIFMLIMVLRPEFMLVDNPFRKGKGFKTFEDRHNVSKLSREKELDVLLEKIGKNGMDSLTKKEKQRLEELANT